MPSQRDALVKIGVARETASGEFRVALVPDALSKLTGAGLEVLVEAGAGDGALIPDSAFEAAGATIVKRDDLYRDSDVILRVQKPSGDGDSACPGFAASKAGCKAGLEMGVTVCQAW